MIPNTKHRTIESSGVAASGSFGISLNDSAHIMTILRDTLYSDKIMAVLREYSSNAWDSHRDAGLGHLPIKVTIPTKMLPVLSIRDFGLGLSHDDVFSVFALYGASTKRNSNDTVGKLGIGSKSGFAYSDSFTIISWHGGTRRTYVAVLDASDKGVINLLHEEPCEDEVGVEIQIAVRVEDVEEFHQKAQILFQYYDPRPDINVILPEKPAEKMVSEHGAIYQEQNAGWTAVMGCIPYRVNLEQLEFVDGGGGIPRFLHDGISGALYFNIGDIEISASREELKYNSPTKRALVDKLNAVIDEFVRRTLSTITQTHRTPWERRLAAQILNQLHLPIPEEHVGMVSRSVSLVELIGDTEEEKTRVPESFTVFQNKEKALSIAVTENVRLVLRDDPRSLLGFRLRYNDYVIRPVEKTSWDIVLKDLEGMLTALDLTGIPVCRLSEMIWQAPQKSPSGKTINIKHKVKTFRLKPEGPYYSPWSRCWEVENREPQADDVFVIIDGFRTRGFDVFYLYQDDLRLAEQFGKTLPPIYAYKSTDKSPISAESRIGKPYQIWREEWAMSLIDDTVKEQLSQWKWANILPYRYYRDDDKTRMDRLTKLLGSGHQITAFVAKHVQGKLILEDRDRLRGALANLDSRFKKMLDRYESEDELAAIRAKYPLLSLPGIGLEDIWGEHAKKWSHYILTIDNAP